MATVEYYYGEQLLRISDGVLEQFARHAVGSVRTPLPWVCVALEPRKHDQVRAQIGTAANEQAPFYSTPAFLHQAFVFEVPADEEPRLRAFLDEAARLSGRAT